MKRAQPSGRSGAAKSKAGPRNYREYAAGLSEPARKALNEMRAAIRSAVPAEATETISYKIPAFRHKRILVWFAAFADHCSLFPTASVIAAFKNELKDYRTSKGTIHFPLDRPIPAKLIGLLVKARVAQMDAKKRR